MLCFNVYVLSACDNDKPSHTHNIDDNGTCLSCGRSFYVSEQDFNQALTKFNNYTVKVEIDYKVGKDYKATLMVMGEYGKVRTYIAHEEYYTKSSEESIEEQARFYVGYVHVFQDIQFDYFSYKNGWLVCNSDSLSIISDKVAFYDVTSAKIKIVNQKIVMAKVTAQSTYSDDSMEIDYVFSNYGSTTFRI